jgi:hypothetical protein
MSQIEAGFGGPARGLSWRQASHLIQINVRHAVDAGKVGSCDLPQNERSFGRHAFMMWHHIATAPFDCDLELAVIDGDGQHALVFPCRRILGGWMNAETKERLEVHPTHWRRWPERANDGTVA